MRCDRCQRDAIVYQPYSGVHLCERHFTADLEAKAKREIRRHQWVRPGDRIAVALSGGKDSSALLVFLARLLSRRKDVELLALTVDEGICSYRDPDLARRIAEREGVPWKCVSFSNEFGKTLDAIVAAKGGDLACSYCGVLRRLCLNRGARMLGATKLAMGLNLDDEAQSVLMNVLRGDADRLLQSSVPREGFVPRIKPFRTVPEREVALYALLNVEGFEQGRCPYAESALREEVRTMLNAYTLRHPSTKHALVNLGETLPLRTGAQSAAPMQRCNRCGEPCTGECRACAILDDVENHA
jgi:uncharacterized protein (TIGR00269 family)